MNIFVGNLAFTATADEVRQLFEGYGVVDTVRLLNDRETGQPRGFGFVEMPNATEAQAAIAGLNGKDLGGRPLTINEARPREERGGSVVRWPSVVSGMRAPRRAAWPACTASAPQQMPPCLAISASSARMRRPCSGSRPEGGEMGVCEDCYEPASGTDVDG